MDGPIAAVQQSAWNTVAHTASGAARVPAPVGGAG